VCHLNEGHAAFAVLERARSFMQETHSPSKPRWPSHEPGTFSPPTTAVVAGFDRFAPALIEQYLGGYAKQKLSLTLHDCWPWAGRTRAIRQRVSTWPIWRSAAAER